MTMLVLMEHDRTDGPERVHHTLLQISMIGSLTPDPKSQE